MGLEDVVTYWGPLNVQLWSERAWRRQDAQD
jgi:hypothetical protein